MQGNLLGKEFTRTIRPWNLILSQQGQVRDCVGDIALVLCVFRVRMARIQWLASVLGLAQELDS